MEETKTLWDRIERTELSVEGVSRGTGFGRSAGLRIHGKIYAIRKSTDLILKLPRKRVDELINSGIGRAWGPNPRRTLREWIAIPTTCNDNWVRRQFSRCHGVSWQGLEKHLFSSSFQSG